MAHITGIQVVLIRFAAPGDQNIRYWRVYIHYSDLTNSVMPQNIFYYSISSKIYKVVKLKQLNLMPNNKNDINMFESVKELL